MSEVCKLNIHFVRVAHSLYNCCYSTYKKELLIVFTGLGNSWNINWTVNELFSELRELLSSDYFSKKR